MKKVLSTMLMIVAFAGATRAQQIEKLFDKYQDNEQFNYIYQRKESTFDRLDDLGDENNEKIYASMVGAAKKMLTLKSSATPSEDRFAKEIEDALKADKYENSSYVRNGKNKVAKYYRTTSKGADKVTVIQNPGNMMIIWQTYVPKK